MKILYIYLFDSFHFKKKDNKTNGGGSWAGSLNTGTSRLVHRDTTAVIRGHPQAAAAVRSVLVAPVMETDKIRNKIRASTVRPRLVLFFSSKYGSHRDELDVKWRVEMVVQGRWCGDLKLERWCGNVIWRLHYCESGRCWDTRSACSVGIGCVLKKSGSQNWG